MHVFVSAVAQARLKQLREQEDKRRQDELQQEQLAERLGIEEAHMAELREFNALWDAKVCRLAQSTCIFKRLESCWIFFPVHFWICLNSENVQDLECSRNYVML